MTKGFKKERLYFSCMTIDQVIQIFLLGAAIALTYVIYSLVNQQRITNQQNVMPWFRIDLSQCAGGGRCVYVQVEKNIARNVRGKIFMRKETESPERFLIVGISSRTAMPKEERGVPIVSGKIDECILRFRPGDIVRIQADLEYESILKGKYKSSHWLIVERVGEKGTKPIKFDMDYEKMPF